MSTMCLHKGAVSSTVPDDAYFGDRDDSDWKLERDKHVQQRFDHGSLSVFNTFTRLFQVMISYSILFYSILFYSILFYSILLYSILVYSILFYSILFYSILFYPRLVYAILCYSTLL